MKQVQAQAAGRAASTTASCADDLLDNNERTFKKLGVDVLKFRPNWKVVRKLMLESLRRKGDFCWHCHTGIFSYPMQIAVKFKVPLVIWGEPSAEYTSYYGYDEDEEVDERRFNRFVNLGITAEDMLGMLDGRSTMRDLEPFAYPPLGTCALASLGLPRLLHSVGREAAGRDHQARARLEGRRRRRRAAGLRIREDRVLHAGRPRLPQVHQARFSPTTHLTSIDIRNRRMYRETRARLIEAHEGQRPASLDVFLEYVGIDEEEFMEIERGTPSLREAVRDTSSQERGAPLWDQDDCDRARAQRRTSPNLLDGDRLSVAGSRSSTTGWATFIGTKALAPIGDERRSRRPAVCAARRIVLPASGPSARA